MQFVRQHKLHTAIAHNSSDPFGSPPFLLGGSLRVTRWGFPYVKGRQIACVIPSAAEESLLEYRQLPAPPAKAGGVFLCCRAVSAAGGALFLPSCLPLPRRRRLPVSLCRAVAVCSSASAAPPPFARLPLLRLFCLLVCLCRPAASVCPPALAAGGNFFPPIFAKGLKPAKKCGILFS